MWVLFGDFNSGLGILMLEFDFGLHRGFGFCCGIWVLFWDFKSGFLILNLDVDFGVVWGF